MFSLPLGLIGSLFLLFLTNNTLNLYSLIGILVMDGLVAKNGTLLLDYTLTLMHEQGLDPRMAVVVIGGLLTSTVFTLVIIPILFVFMEKHSLFRRKSA